MLRFLLILCFCLALVPCAPAQAQPACPTTSVEVFTPLVPRGVPPARTTNPRQARIETVGQVVLYDYGLAGFPYVAWTPLLGFAYVQVGGTSVAVPGGNGTAILVDSPCKIVLLVEPTGVGPGGPTPVGSADLNHDGKVDVFDLAILAEQFGR